MDKIEKYFELALITEKQKGTRTIYRSHISKYFKAIEKDLETYFDNAPEYDDKDDKKLKKYNEYYETDLRGYWNYLQGKAPKTQQVAISAIKGFLKRFDRHTKELDIWDDIKARMKGKSDPISEKHVPDIDELKQILHYCDIRTKTAIMVSLSGGLRISEVCQLLPGDINLNEKPARINIRAEIAKNGKRRTTFITPETTDMLIEWLRVRDDYVKKSLASLNFKNVQFIKDRKDSRIFPYHTNAVRTGFNNACAKAGFDGVTEMMGDFDLSEDFKRDHKHKRARRKLTYHNLRAFYRTYLGNADLAEHLMGHSGYLSTYRMFNDKQLAKEYLKQMHNLMVYETSSDERINTLDEQLKNKDTEIQELNKKLEAMDRDLRTLIIKKLTKNEREKK